MLKVNSPREFLVALKDFGFNSSDAVVVGVNSLFVTEIISVKSVFTRDDIIKAVIENDSDNYSTHHIFVCGIFNDLINEFSDNEFELLADDITNKKTLDSMIVDFSGETWWSTMCIGDFCDCSEDNPQSFSLEDEEEEDEYDEEEDDEDEDDEDNEGFYLSDELLNLMFKNLFE